MKKTFRTLVAGLMLAEMVAVLGARYFSATGSPAPEAPGVGYSNTKELGRLIYTEYVYAFEIAAVLLLVAMVAAIALTLRRRKDTRYNDPSAAVRTRRDDRVRLVRMPAQPRDRSQP